MAYTVASFILKGTLQLLYCLLLINAINTAFPPFTTECKHLLSVGMLNVDTEKRWDISHLRITHWMSGVVYPLTPYRCTKYQVEDCLPMTLPRNPSINKPSSNVYSAQQPAFPVEMSPVETVTASLSKATFAGMTSTPKKNKAWIDPLEKSLNTSIRSNRSVKKKISKAGKKLVKTIHAGLKIRL